MEQLPSTFDGKRITLRQPYDMPGELLIANGDQGLSYQPSVFNNNTDRPFEIHRAIFRLSAFNDATPPVQVDPVTAQGFKDVLNEYIRLSMQGPREARITKSNTLLSTLLRRDRFTWEWEAPYTINKGEGLVVTVDNLLADFVVGAITVHNLKVALTFQGYKLTCEAPLPGS